MEFINFDGIDLAALVPQIPRSVKDKLPFGLIRLDLAGTVLEYNMTEGEMMGVDPNWAIGKNFFKEVATCTKPDAFYGRFVEGVKKGFLNTVFDYTFNHQGVTTSVKVTMITLPDHLGRKSVMVMVKRANKPLIADAIAQPATTANALPETVVAALRPATTAAALAVTAPALAAASPPA